MCVKRRAVPQPLLVTRRSRACSRDPGSCYSHGLPSRTTAAAARPWILMRLIEAGTASAAGRPARRDLARTVTRLFPVGPPTAAFTSRRRALALSALGAMGAEERLRGSFHDAVRFVRKLPMTWSPVTNRAVDLLLTITTASSTARISCTDNTGNRTDSTRDAGIPGDPVHEPVHAAPGPSSRNVTQPGSRDLPQRRGRAIA
jgi:hypothetical protein